MKIFAEQRKSGIPRIIYIVVAPFVAGAILVWFLRTPASKPRKELQASSVPAESAAVTTAPARTSAPEVISSPPPPVEVTKPVPAVTPPPKLGPVVVNPPPAPPQVDPEPRVVAPLTPDPVKKPIPVAPRGEVGKPVDLLKQIIPTRDTADGGWRIRNNILEYPAPTQYGSLRLRYTPGDEYDFRAVFMRTSGDNDIGFNIVSGKKRALYSVCGWHNTVAGFHGINGMDADNDANPTKRLNGIENNKEYTLLVQVRMASIRVLLNDKELMNYKFTKQEFTGVTGQPVNKSDPILGVYCSSVTAKFSVLEVIELPPPPVDAPEQKSPTAPF